MGSQPISIQLGKILRENLAGNCCRKILREIVARKSCGKFLWENLAGNSCGKWRRGKSQFKKGSDWWKFSIWNRVMGSQPISIQLRRILQENLVGNCCGKILQEIVVGKSCGKLLWENLVGNSCGKFLWEMEEGKSQFKKGSDWWKFSIWNRVMGSQPISIQLRKILWENLAGNCCRKILREIVAGKSCGKFLWENLAGNCCGKILWEILAGNSCGKWRRGKSQFKKDCDWWKFTIWNRVIGEPTNQYPAQENLAGKSCEKLLQENLAGNCCGKILWEIVAGNSCGKWRRGKSQFKKGSDWWKFTIWNRVMGSQPISIQLGKILRENLAGNCCRKILREIVAGKSCGKFLRENVVGNSCGKFLWENVVGNSCGKMLREIVAGNSCRKSCGKFLREMLWEIPHTYLQTISEGNFQNMQFI